MPLVKQNVMKSEVFILGGDKELIRREVRDGGEGVSHTQLLPSNIKACLPVSERGFKMSDITTIHNWVQGKEISEPKQGTLFFVCLIFKDKQDVSFTVSHS